MISELFNPQNYLFSIDALLAILASTVILILGACTLVREWDSDIRLSYFLFTLPVFIIFFSSIFTRITISLDVMPFWDIGSHIGLLMIPPAFLNFSAKVLRLREENRILTYFCSVISVMLLLLLVSTDLFVTGYQQYPWGFEADYGSVGLIFAFYFIAMIIYVLLMYWRTLKNKTRGSILWLRAKWMLVANLIGFMAIIDLAPAFGVHIYPFGSVFVVILFVLMSVVTWRFKLLDIDAKYAAESIIKTMHDGLIVLDHNFNVRLENDAVFLHCKIYDDDFMRNLLKSKIELLILDGQIEGGVKDLELEYFVGDHTRHYLNISISPISQYEANTTAYVCVFRDITTKKIAEDLLIKSHIDLERKVAYRTKSLESEIDNHVKTAESLLFAKEEAEKANHVKGQFLANVSHELRTPLHAILSFSKLGEKKAEGVEKDKIRSYFDKIIVSGERLLILVNDLLDLSRLESGKAELHLQMVDIEEISQQCIDVQTNLLEQKNVKCVVSVEIIEPSVNCDRKRIFQVITNLLANAINYSPINGSINIKIIVADNVTNITNEIEALHDNHLDADGLLFSIEDEGRGIPVDELEKVFDKFIQSSQTDSGSGGTGLGLAICKEIILLHKGLIYAEQGKKGARFVFYIPRSEF